MAHCYIKKLSLAKNHRENHNQILNILIFVVINFLWALRIWYVFRSSEKDKIIFKHSNITRACFIVVFFKK